LTARHRYRDGAPGGEADVRRRTGANLPVRGSVRYGGSGQLRDGPPRRDDLLPRGGTEPVGRHLQLHALEVPVAEHLHGLALADRAGGDQLVRPHRAARREQLGQPVQVHHLVVGLEPVPEPLELGQPHVDGRLATLERRRDLLAGPGALGAAPGRLALGALTTADPRLGGPGAGRRPEVVDLDRHLLDLLDPDEVADGVDHPADLRAILLHHHVVDVPQPQRAQGRPLVGLTAEPRADLGHLQSRHHAPVPAGSGAVAALAWAASIAAGATSSTGNPRRLATASGGSDDLSACTVACTMLIGLDEPRLLESTSWMPAHSSTARTGPPAITPVPALAGLSSTTPAASSPRTGCGIVPPMRGTLKKCFLASSTPLAMAAGTSFALP